MGSRTRLLIALALFAALLAPPSNLAGATLDNGKLVPAGALVIAGRRLSCGPTATLVRNFEGFAVSSTVIVLNMKAIAPLPRVVQWLIYYHECGHVLLGPSETGADCYAVRRARSEGWLTPRGLEQICAVFNIAGHGPVHPDPVERCNQLRQCFGKGGGAKRPLQQACTSPDKNAKPLLLSQLPEGGGGSYSCRR